MKKILEYMVFTFVIADIVYLIGMVYVLIHDYIWKKRGKKRKILSGVSIKVLLPALREVSLVKETIENFDSILNEYKNSIAYIITTQKEDEEIKEGELSTHKCVLNNIKGHEQFLSLHYCGEKQGKSLQLNHALEYIKSKIAPEEYKKIYIGVYDFDSKPSTHILQEVANIAEVKGYPEIIQQVPLSIKNINSLLKQRKSLLVLHGMQSNIRGMGIEKFRLLLSGKKIQLPMYAMGAGMFIRMDVLLKRGGFPVPVDDLTLGYSAYLRNYRFAPVDSYNYVEIPSSVRAIINQDILIFRGVLSGFLEIKREKSVKGLWLCVELILNVGIRTFVPWLYIIYTIIDLFDGGNFSGKLLILLPYVYSILGWIAMNCQQKIKGNVKTIVMAILLSPIWRVIRTLGAFICIKKLFVAKIQGKEVSYKKTQRD